MKQNDLLGSLQEDRTDYAFPNSADDTSRDKNVLRHNREGWWVKEKIIFRLIFSVSQNSFLLIFYMEVSETCACI